MEPEFKAFFPDQDLKDRDEELYTMIKSESERQRQGINLIASENYTSKAVMQCLGSPLQNKYAEGYPGARYYGGSEYADMIENLAMKRSLEAFSLSEDEWKVNVQPLSGSPANFQVYTALVGSGGKIMGLHLPDGGHLTHGFQMGDKKISATSVFFESKAYETNEDSLIDYDQLEKDAEEFKPNLIIAGYSAYPRDLDYKRFREICDKVGAYLMVDMAHYNGLVVGGILANPFEYADVVTTTTHKMMRGPRGGLIFSKVEISDKINFAVFPQCQGGPHMNQIAGVACQMKEMASEEYKEYAKQVVANAKALAQGLLDKGFTLVTGGTDNHLMLWNCKPAGLTGAKVDLVLEQMHIFSNKNSIKGDKSAAIAPGAVRLGTPAVTTRGMKEDDMKTIADFCEKAHSRALEIQEKAGSKKIADFKDVLKNEDFTEIQNEIHAFAEKFEMPGEVKF